MQNDDEIEVERILSPSQASAGTYFNRVRDGGSVYSSGTDFQRMDDDRSERSGTVMNRVPGGS